MSKDLGRRSQYPMFTDGVLTPKKRDAILEDIRTTRDFITEEAVREISLRIDEYQSHPKPGELFPLTLREYVQLVERLLFQKGKSKRN